MKRDLFRKWLAGMAFMVMALMVAPGMGLAENGDTYFEQGTRLLKETRLEEAVWAFTETIRLAPDRVEAYTNRGLAYLEEKKYGQAKQDFLKALAIAPNDVKANNNLGVFYCGLQDYDNALRYILRAASARNLSGPYGAVVYKNLGFIYTKKGMLEEAGAAYGKAGRMTALKPLSRLDRRGYGEEARDYALTLEFKGVSGEEE